MLPALNSDQAPERLHWLAALLLDALAGGLPLEQAARRASDGVYEALLKG